MAKEFAVALGVGHRAVSPGPMVFNSLTFILFFLAVTGVSQSRASWGLRKCALTLFSYAFYAAWYPATILLLWASTTLDFLVTHGMARARSSSARRLLLVSSLGLNLGLLGFYKYSAFFALNANLLLTRLGLEAAIAVPHVVLPVGISFYTFMSLAFVIDVYRGRAQPPKSFLDFALFLTFYPHLVAGPIVRSQDFLPQCEQPRSATTRQISWGLTLIAFGLFEKTVLADALLAPVADRMFAAARLGAMDAWVGALAFSGQIFCDFAGYSTCAVGAAACLGFMLPRNFKNPYSAAGFSEFWQRWHMSLSTWLRDYLYISLGGNRKGPWRTLANLLVTMLLGGLWHGASWMFLAWGALHGFYLCVERMLRPVLQPFALSRRTLVRPFAVALTFVAVTLAWVPFRAPNAETAVRMVRAMAGSNGLTHLVLNKFEALIVLLTVAGILASQNLFRDVSLEEVADRAPQSVAVLALSAMIVMIATMAGDDRSFIYFQF